MDVSEWYNTLSQVLCCPFYTHGWLSNEVRPQIADSEGRVRGRQQHPPLFHSFHYLVPIPASTLPFTLWLKHLVLFMDLLHLYSDFLPIGTQSSLHCSCYTQNYPVRRVRLRVYSWPRVTQQVFMAQSWGGGILILSSFLRHPWTQHGKPPIYNRASWTVMKPEGLGGPTGPVQHAHCN